MIISREDLKIIGKVKVDDKPWDNPLVSDLKQKIKEHYRIKGKEQCCYCKKNFHGEFKFVIDIEHILPKGHIDFKYLIFTPNNLNVACKRCNMNIKGQKIDFITSLSDIKSDYQNSKFYKFIHPNFDNYFDHIKYHCQILDDQKLINYQIKNNSKKGAYTYEYFRLNELEVESINRAQGVRNIMSLPKRLSQNIKDRLTELVSKL